LDGKEKSINFATPKKTHRVCHADHFTFNSLTTLKFNTSGIGVKEDHTSLFDRASPV